MPAVRVRGVRCWFLVFQGLLQTVGYTA